jgi:hypothetical protein
VCLRRLKSGQCRELIAITFIISDILNISGFVSRLGLSVKYQHRRFWMAVISPPHVTASYSKQSVTFCISQRLFDKWVWFTYRSEDCTMSTAYASAVTQRVPTKPRSGVQEMAQPAPTWVLSPCPDGLTCEEIIIGSPPVGHRLGGSVQVTGLASFAQDGLWAAVLDGAGAKMGVARCWEMRSSGQPSAFTATVEFTPPANSQSGRIQVWRESSSDGAIVHLTSISVIIQGYDLDLLLSRLETAIAAKDYAALDTTIAEPFLVTVDATKPKVLSLAEATDLLRREYLGPGLPKLDFSADTSAFVRRYTRAEQHIIAAISSSGWGAAKEGVAILLVAAVDGHARWVGLHFFTRPLS